MKQFFLRAFACLAFLILFVAVTLVWFIYLDKKPSDIDDASIRRVVKSTGRFELPDNFQILYTANKWGSADSKIPRSLCYVIKSSKEYIKELRASESKIGYHREGCWPIDDVVEWTKGCSGFKNSSAQSFEKISDGCFGPRGGRIFVNDNDNVVMFERYLFD